MDAAVVCGTIVEAFSLEARCALIGQHRCVITVGMSRVDDAAAHSEQHMEAGEHELQMPSHFGIRRGIAVAPKEVLRVRRVKRGELGQARAIDGSDHRRILSWHDKGWQNRSKLMQILPDQQA